MNQNKVSLQAWEPDITTMIRKQHFEVDAEWPGRIWNVVLTFRTEYLANDTYQEPGLSEVK